MQSDRIYLSAGMLHMFKQDSALGHRACKMVEFLDRETHDFMSLCCSVLSIFLLANQINFTMKQRSN